jgi:hypothetical protein
MYDKHLVRSILIQIADALQKIVNVLDGTAVQKNLPILQPAWSRLIAFVCSSWLLVRR